MGINISDAPNTLADLKMFASVIRFKLELVFSPDTAQPGTLNGLPPSAGHCAAVALVLNRLTGADIASACVNGVSHWLNRFRFGSESFDMDLTGDQFGLQPIRISEPNQALYEDTRLRSSAEASIETIKRSELLLNRLQKEGKMPDLRKEIDHLFTYHPPDSVTGPKYDKINSLASDALALADSWLDDGSEPTFDIITQRLRDMYEMVEELCPRSADKSAALRCIRLARNCLNECFHKHKGDMPDGQLLMFARFNILSAKYQANSSIALNQ